MKKHPDFYYYNTANLANDISNRVPIDNQVR